MQIKISGHTFKLYNQVAVNLKYDSIADTFSFALYYNSADPIHKRIFKPGTYLPCTITHRGVLVMTGVVLSHHFGSAGDPPKQLVYVSGYSTTGMLGDSCILNTTQTDFGVIVLNTNSTTVAVPPSALQFDGMTLEQIAHRVCGWYEIPVRVDDELQKDNRFTAPFPYVSGEKVTDYTKTTPAQTVGEFLDILCKQKNVILTHTKKGELLITRAKVDKMLTTSETKVVRENVLSSSKSDVFDDPGDVFTTSETKTTATNRAVLYDFSNPGKWLDMSLDFNGQALHRIIQVVGQDSQGNPDNSLDSAILNPYVEPGVSRYMRVIQTAGDDNDTIKTARAILGDQLKNIAIIVEIQGWTLGGNLVTPNQIVTVKNPDLHIYKKTKLFIQEVAFKGDEKSETATLRCVLPECFNQEPVKNIFE